MTSKPDKAKTQKGKVVVVLVTRSKHSRRPNAAKVNRENRTEKIPNPRSDPLRRHVWRGPGVEKSRDGGASNDEAAGKIHLQRRKSYHITRIMPARVKRKKPNQSKSFRHRYLHISFHAAHRSFFIFSQYNVDIKKSTALTDENFRKWLKKIYTRIFCEATEHVTPKFDPSVSSIQSLVQRGGVRERRLRC
ncbi:hypothetical protein H6P81_011798 [Aristolochia fimbriata]|uniref:Uncharacterized protein n=1 Tax=Aristolochia fimbriata TaxID=158543 RepID=A0AAV7E9Z8_ARIFI|nr:hypothetical protein H6P81_011798 [Aristolochia fimbriata]